ncbi:response regulator [Hymenobacter sp. B1770]|uniref:response regulator n=1 Tax=Hymenobacter sp. B1770 TaxID=1718788 RepID=UPI003CFB72B3
MPALPLILLIDDDYTVNFLNTKLLRYLDPDVQVLTALNGREGLDLLRTHCHPPAPSRPALVLLDINMPLMDGFEFLQAYQQVPETERQGVVIFMLTSSVSPRDQSRLQGLPVDGFLSKPLTEEKVAQVLADHFPPQKGP